MARGRVGRGSALGAVLSQEAIHRTTSEPVTQTRRAVSIQFSPNGVSRRFLRPDRVGVGEASRTRLVPSPPSGRFAGALRPCAYTMRNRKSLQRHSRAHRSSRGVRGQFLLRILGDASLIRADLPDEPVLILGPGKLLAVLAYLACAPSRRSRTEELLDVFWASQDSTAAHHDLRQAIWQLRRRLGHDLLATGRGALLLRAEVGVDRDEFLAALEVGALERAVELYRGEFLAGLGAAAAVGFEQWVDVERYRLQRAFSRAAEMVVRQWLSVGRFVDAQRLARRLRDADPHEEATWVLLLETLMSAGARVGAAAEADMFERVLAADGREPERDTRALLQRVRRTSPDGPHAGPFKPLVATLVGRDREFGVLARAWDRARAGQGGHVHVEGHPGIGKTRLLRDFHARLEAGGAHTLYLRARFAGRRVVFGVASELVAALAEMPGSTAVSPGAIPALVALNPMLSARFPATPDVARGEEALRRRTLAVLDLLAAVAEEQPVAVLCDDLQWIDPASSDLFQWLFSKLDELRVLCVTTAPPTRRPVWARATSECLSVLPLSVEGVRALLTSLGTLPDASWGRTLAEKLHTVSEGIPKRILERLERGLERGCLSIGPSGWSSHEPETVASEVLATAIEPMDLMVLPFTILGTGGPDHLATGLTEGLISDLSRVAAFRVVALSSALRLQGLRDDLVALRSAVRARHVLDGTVRADGDQIEIAARVRVLASGAVLREERCRGPRADLFALRQRLARATIEALNVRLSPTEELDVASQPVTDMLAYECYLRARQCVLRYDPLELERALEILRQGLELAGENALLYAMLGIVYWQLVNTGVNPDEAVLNKAEHYAAKAFALDPNLAQGHVLAGCIAQARGRVRDCVQHYRRALELDPNNADALLWLALVYTIAGKTFAANSLATRLLELDPLTGMNQLVPGAIAAVEGRYEEAVAAGHREQEIDRSPPGRVMYAIALIRAGHLDEGHDVIDQLTRDVPDGFATRLGVFMQAAVRGHRRQACETITATFEMVARRHAYLSWHVGAGFAMLGEANRSLEWLHHALNWGFVSYPFLMSDPLLERLRRDPAFSALAERAKSEWEAFEL